MIRTIREARGFTQASLADKLGVVPSTVAMWERGESAPRAALLPKIADTLGCTIDELLRENPSTKAAGRHDTTAAGSKL